jgi:hypothetical protein
MWALTVALPLWRISPPHVLRRCSLGSCGAIALLSGAHHGRRQPTCHQVAPPPTMHADSALVPHRSNKGHRWVWVVTGSGWSTTVPCFPLSVAWGHWLVGLCCRRLLVHWAEATRPELGFLLFYFHFFLFTDFYASFEKSYKFIEKSEKCKWG